MPTSFEVASAEGNYAVEIKQGAAEELLARFPHAHVLVDDRLKLSLPNRPAIAINATEEAKEYEAIGDILKRLRELKLTRSGTLIAVGGGVVQDIAGFAASIYMRGIRWHYAPTTLLGMVDSCIGGKSSINVRGSKNLVGTFHPPSSVAVDPAFIATLSLEQKIAGLCEAAKICFAHPDASAFSSYLALKCIENESPATYEAVITKSLHAKKWFIETDEFDRNERLLLNFGHGFGHAIEAAGDYTISHGIAVGIGMICAIEFQMLSERGFTCHERVAALRQHIDSMLNKLPELKANVKRLKPDEVLNAFRADKKHSPTEYAIIAPDSKGILIRKRVPRNDATDTQLKHSMQKVFTIYG